MTAPNIAGLATVTGKTAALVLANTLTTDVLANAASSNKVFKINSLIVSNVDGSAAAAVSIMLQRGGQSTFYLASDIDVPAETTLIVISKDTQIYLEEDDKIRAVASNGNDLNIICSYEEIS
tara:strand:+ start:2500 stop:2865 length:366 start_codon:yes stop_codon:yes gene_type:complete